MSSNPNSPFRAMPGKVMYKVGQSGLRDNNVEVKVVERVVERIVYRDPPPPKWTVGVHAVLTEHVDRPVSDDERFAQCQICQEQARCIAMGKCGHCSSCVRCTNALYDKAVAELADGVKCPVCRTVSKTVFFVWL